ncbi:MAG: uroporphyrinogen-III decarboxylase, partial [Eubacteriales bacterium]|nr:uroporphyrinogen-III decarboxylase [Eubacteriales bacterium]
FKKAIALEKPDKTPMQFNAEAFCARQMGVKLSEFAVNAELSITTIINCINMLGDIDVMDIGAMYAPILGTGNLAKVKIPGRQLPEDSLWQVDETERMTVEDYDTILDKGFEAFYDDFMVTRLEIDMHEFHEQLAKMAEGPQRYAEAGYVNSSTIMANGEVDFLTGGRTIPKFMRDLYRMPDKVYAVLDVIHEYNISFLKQQLQAGDAVTVFCGAGRGNCELYPPKIWERIVWKYYKGVADLVTEAGVAVQWHMDGNYELGLPYFRELKKRTCLFCPDGLTDIYKVKEVLGDMMCIRGDVQPALLVIGTPDEVYAYANRLIRDMGNGFVMGVGCSTPANAKLENVKAMIAAASGK